MMSLNFFGWFTTQGLNRFSILKSLMRQSTMSKAAFLSLAMEWCGGLDSNQENGQTAKSNNLRTRKLFFLLFQVQKRLMRNQWIGTLRWVSEYSTLQMEKLYPRVHGDKSSNLNKKEKLKWCSIHLKTLPFWDLQKAWGVKVLVKISLLIWTLLTNLARYQRNKSTRVWLMKEWPATLIVWSKLSFFWELSVMLYTRCPPKLKLSGWRWLNPWKAFRIYHSASSVSFITSRSQKALAMQLGPMSYSRHLDGLTMKGTSNRTSMSSIASSATSLRSRCKILTHRRPTKIFLKVSSRV